MPSSGVAGSSLMQSSTFQSRYEKDLELGKAIKAQIDSGIPKGTLRAVASEWLNTYLQYIEKVLTASSDSARMVSHISRVFCPECMDKFPTKFSHLNRRLVDLGQF